MQALIKKESFETAVDDHDIDMSSTPEPTDICIHSSDTTITDKTDGLSAAVSEEEVLMATDSDREAEHNGTYKIICD